MSKTVNNIIDSNINNLSSFKAGIFEVNKQAIQSIHAKIMANKDVSVEQDLSQLQKFLSHKLKAIYLDQSKMAKNHT